jgi:hypothetical protein
MWRRDRHLVYPELRRLIRMNVMDGGCKSDHYMIVD